MSGSLEDELKKLSKLPENLRCASCGAETKFGYSNVVPKYKMFVCSECKSALQGFSVRVKSISQSTFDAAEVESFRPRNGGSNDASRRTYQARLPLEHPLRCVRDAR